MTVQLDMYRQILKNEYSEPEARRCMEMLMKYITPVDEIILDGYGHGEMFYKHGGKLCDLIIEAWNSK